MIWRTRIGNRTLWLLDEPIQARGRRRVLLAVDTSDSCWPHRKDEIEAAISSVVAGLHAHDECWLWIMGHDAPSFEARLQDDTDASRATVSRNLSGRLVAEEGGTWLRETAASMLAATRTSTDTIDYLLVVTDGAAIFDAEAVASSSAGSAAAICCLSPAEGNRSATGCARGVQGWSAATMGNLSAWLALERAEMRLNMVVAGGPAYRFETGGRLEPIPVVWPQSTDGGRARYAVVSDTCPQLCVTTARGRRLWTDTPAAATPRIVPAVDGLPRELQSVGMRVWGLQLDWRTEVFDVLMTSPHAAILCPNCRAPYTARDVRGGQHVFCELCRAFLLVNGWARRDDPALADNAAVCWDATRGARIATGHSHVAPDTELAIPLDRVSF